MRSGPPPRVEIIDARSVVRPDGGRVTLERPRPDTPCCDQPGLSYFGFTRYADGWLTLTSSDTPEVYHHAFDGSVDHRSLDWQLAGPSRNGRWALVAGPVAVGPQGAVMRWQSRGGDGAVAGFVGRRRILFDGKRGVYVGRPDGSVRPVPGWAHAFTTSSVGPVAVGETREGHRGVFAVPSGQEILNAQRLTDPFSFDPTGRWIVGADADCYCGLTVTEVRTGRTVLTVRGVSFDERQPPYWEDERHLLVVASDRLYRSYVLRVGLDGSIAIAYGPSAGGIYAGYVVPRPRP